MSAENNLDVPYLLALKRQAIAEAANAAAQEREARPEEASSAAGDNLSGPERLSNSEKRRSPRYKCEGTVELVEEGCQTATSAAFTDISLHGCFLEAQATYPVGTALHMRLEANGCKVQTRGTVRVCYPYHGMGIAFREMSDEDRARLKELLRTISRPSVIVVPRGAATSSASGPAEAAPPISNPGAAMQALLAVFEERPMLMREEFLRILRKSQAGESGTEP